MLILAVDTSTRAGSLAALRDSEVLGEIDCRSDEPYSSRLFQDLDRLLAQIGLSPGEFDVFAVGAGPGSFTGLRVGLTAVKAWAEIYDRPVAAVSGLEAVAAQAGAEAGQIVAPVIDARRGQVFGALYQRPLLGSALGEGAVLQPLRPMTEDVIMEAEQFVEMALEQAAGGNVQFISPAPEVLDPAMQRFRLCSSCVLKASGILAPWIGRLGYEKALRGEVVDALHLDANYVRRPDAEVRWKGF